MCNIRILLDVSQQRVVREERGLQHNDLPLHLLHEDRRSPVPASNIQHHAVRFDERGEDFERTFFPIMKSCAPEIPVIMRIPVRVPINRQIRHTTLLLFLTRPPLSVCFGARPCYYWNASSILLLDRRCS